MIKSRYTNVNTLNEIKELFSVCSLSVPAELIYFL